MARTGVRRARLGLVAALVGDTLWEIARTRVGAAADPRPFIEEIRDLSGLATSSLRAGEVLLVPAV